VNAKALVALSVGGVVGGTLLGVGAASVALVIGPFPRLEEGLVLGLVSMAAAFTVWPRGRYAMPERRCQVDPSLLRRSSRQVAAYHWGKKLGTGVQTFVVTPAFYGMLALIVATGPIHALLLSVLYGASRAAAIDVGALSVSRHRSATAPEPGLGLESRSRPVVVSLLALSTILSMSAMARL
jgi:hypothetical protein